MTEEELEEFKAFKEAKAKKAAELAAQEKREDYKILVDETIEASIADLMDVSKKLSDVKKKVYDNFTAVIDLKKEVILNRNYDTIRSHTFTNTEGTKRIRLGVLMLDGYNDTVEDGIQKHLKEFKAQSQINYRAQLDTSWREKASAPMAVPQDKGWKGLKEKQKAYEYAASAAKQIAASAAERLGTYRTRPTGPSHRP